VDCFCIAANCTEPELSMCCVLFQIIIPFFSIFVKDIYVLNEGCLNRSVTVPPWIIQNAVTSIDASKVKVKGTMPQLGRRRGAHLPLAAVESVGGLTTWVRDAWPVWRQTFPALGHHRPLTSTKLYCLVTEAHVCEQLASGHYSAVSWCGVEPAPLSDLRITSPARYR